MYLGGGSVELQMGWLVWGLLLIFDVVLDGAAVDSEGLKKVSLIVKAGIRNRPSYPTFRYTEIFDLLVQAVLDNDLVAAKLAYQAGFNPCQRLPFNYSLRHVAQCPEMDLWLQGLGVAPAESVSYWREDFWIWEEQDVCNRNTRSKVFLADDGTGMQRELFFNDAVGRQWDRRAKYSKVLGRNPAWRDVRGKYPEDYPIGPSVECDIFLSKPTRQELAGYLKSARYHKTR